MRRVESFQGTVDVARVGPFPAMEFVEDAVVVGVCHEDAGKELIAGSTSEAEGGAESERSIWTARKDSCIPRTRSRREPGEGEFMQVDFGFRQGELLAGRNAPRVWATCGLVFGAQSVERRHSRP